MNPLAEHQVSPGKESDKASIKAFITTSIEKIRKAHNENYLSIFAGAGISANSELPNWNDLINEIKKRLYGNKKEEKEQEDYLVLAEKFYNQFKENYYQTLKTLIPDNAKPNVLHSEIVKLNIRNLITTNWDNLFEQAIDEEGMFFDIIKCDKDIGISTGFSKFIKMHGSLDGENIVFKEQDYLDYSKNFPLIENYVKGVFSTDTVILLGYSLRDPNVKQIISWVNSCSKTTKPIYFIKTSGGVDSIEFEFYKNKNIHILYLEELYGDERKENRNVRFLQEIQIKEQNKPEIKLLLSNEEIEELAQILMEFDRNALDKKISDLETCSKERTLRNRFLMCFLLFENRLDNENLQELYLKYKNISREAFKYKEHRVWFLSEFNKYWGFSSLECNKDSNKEWEEKFLKLPFTVREQLRDIMDLEHYLDKRLLSIHHSFMQIEKSHLYWKNGGFSYDNGSNLNDVLKVLLEVDRLRIGNCLAIPRFEEHIILYTKALECYWLEVSILFLRTKQESCQIDENILSYTIRYFRTQELRDIFQKTQSFPLFEVNQEFLQQIFTNICCGFKEYGAFTTRNSRWFDNFLFLASFCRLNQETFDKVLEEFSQKIQEEIASYVQYENIKYFISFQSKNKELKFEKCLDMIFSFLNRFVKERAGGYELFAMGIFLEILKVMPEIDKKYKAQILEFIDQIHRKVYICDENNPNSVLESPQGFEKELEATINNKEVAYYPDTFIPFIERFYRFSDEDTKGAIKEKLEYVLSHPEEYQQIKKSQKYCQILKNFIENLKD